MSRVRRTESKFPETLRINGYEWTFVVRDQINEQGQECVGLCLPHRHEIHIVPGHSAVVSTILHEVIHAACPSLSEDAVAEAERGVMAVLRDNPQFAKWLADGCA